MPVRTLRPGVGRRLLLVAGSAAFVAVGIWLIVTQGQRADGGEVTVGWLAVVFFGLCLVAALVMALPGSTYLLLDAEGMLPNTYGMRAEDLADLVTGYWRAGIMPTAVAPLTQLQDRPGVWTMSAASPNSCQRYPVAIASR
jgi:hypothetical protein